MSHDSLDRLQREASELYLSGDFPRAVKTWREVLRIDPGNADALEGVRMASALCEPEVDAERADETVPRNPSTERDIDKTLDAFFELMPAVAPASGTPGAEPSGHAVTTQSVSSGSEARHSEGIDFGDLSEVDSIPIAAGSELEIDAGDVAADDGDSIGLAMVSDADRRKTGEASSGPSPAAMELRRRVGALLREAKDKADAGDRDGALAVLGRLYILDEENADARALEAALRDQAAKDLEAVDRWLTGGIEAYDARRYAEAKEFFTRVLKAVPGHREAIDYLESITDREASATPPVPSSKPSPPIEDDLFAGADLLGEPIEEIPLSTEPAGPEAASPEALVFDEGAAETAGAVFGDLEAPPPERPEEARAPRAASAPSFEFKRDRGLPRWAIAVAAGALVLAGVAFAGLKIVGLFSTPGNEMESAPAAATAPRTPAARADEPAADRGVASPEPRSAAAASVPVALDKARRAMDARDYGAAVIAFNDALTIDPTSREALEGLQRAGDLYKARKVVEDQIDKIRMAFEDGEYTSALRLIYRLPEGLDRKQVDGWKANGWFNLGLVALRAGEASQAVGHFDEALATQRDQEIESWRAFAIRYRDLPKDSAYYSRVEGAPFRRLDD